MIRVLPVFDDLARFILDVFEDLGFVQLGHCQKKFWIVLENPSGESSTSHEEQQNIQLIESITTKFSSLDIVIHYKLTNPLNETNGDLYYKDIQDIEASKFRNFIVKNPRPKPKKKYRNKSNYRKMKF